MLGFMCDWSEKSIISSSLDKPFFDPDKYEEELATWNVSFQ